MGRELYWDSSLNMPTMVTIAYPDLFTVEQASNLGTDGFIMSLKAKKVSRSNARIIRSFYLSEHRHFVQGMC